MAGQCWALELGRHSSNSGFANLLIRARLDKLFNFFRSYKIIYKMIMICKRVAERQNEINDSCKVLGKVFAIMHSKYLINVIIILIIAAIIISLSLQEED